MIGGAGVELEKKQLCLGGAGLLCLGGAGGRPQLGRGFLLFHDGLSVSPLVNTDRKGGAFPIMLQQFRRAIGVAIVSGHAKHKLRRLHYVRATAAEAAHVYNANHSENRWRPSQNGRSSWYSEHIPEGYATFEQFRNGYDFRVP